MSHVPKFIYVCITRRRSSKPVEPVPGWNDHDGPVPRVVGPSAAAESVPRFLRYPVVQCAEIARASGNACCVWFYGEHVYYCSASE